MKKLMRICLSLVLVLTMAVPAFAASVEAEKDTFLFDPEVQAWIDAHPEEVEEFLTSGIETYVRENFEYESVAEMAAYYDDSDGTYIRNILLEFWVRDALDWEYRNDRIAEYEAEHPGALEQLEANAYDYFAQVYPWFDSPEEYMELWNYTEEEFIAEMVDYQITSLQLAEAHTAKLAAFEAAHPGMLAQFEANAYDYFAQEYPWYDSPEEFMEYRNLTEAEFVAQMVDYQISDILYKEAERERIDEAKTALGGVPGEIGVMLNDTYLTFPNAVPEAADGRIMAPYRVLMEALGGEVSFDEASQTVSCILDDTTLTLTLGERALTITENGETTTVEMDCAAYAKDGRTYVPVRFVSQAFGYTALWDDDYETAVLLDLKALLEQSNGNFTILNRALANLPVGAGQTYECRLSANLELTQFDTLHGDQQYRFTAQGDNLTLDGAGQGSLYLDLSSLSDDLGQQSLEYIWSAPANELWLRSTLPIPWDSALQNSWVHMHLDHVLSFQLVPYLASEKLTMGSLLCAAAINSIQGPYAAYYSISPVTLWTETLSAAGEAAAVIGDYCFTHTNQGDTFSFEFGDADYGDAFSLTFTVDAQGRVTGSFQYEDNYSWLWSAPYRITCQFGLDSREFTLSLNYHVKNNYQIQLDLTGTFTQTGRAPLTAPPAGDAVIDWEDLLGW